MPWKKIKIIGLILLGLCLLIPAIIYLNAIDWSKKHSQRIANLPVLDDSANTGEYRLKANNLEFLVRVAGMQNEGPAIILLHGFPESSMMWQSALETAEAKGYRAVAFDQRGYSPGARPKKIAAYHVDSLVQDLIAVANQVGFDTFHLVGHDWGAVVAWKTAIEFPDQIQTLTNLSIPHISVFFNSVLNHPEQKQRSAYIHKLRRPFLPEFLFQIMQNRIAKRQKGIWTDAQIAEYCAIQQEFGATTAMLNWYRAIDLENIERITAFEKKISCPTTFIWGAHDPYVAPSILPLQEKYIDAPYKSIRLETGHSLIQTKTDSVLQAIFSN